MNAIYRYQINCWDTPAEFIEYHAKVCITGNHGAAAPFVRILNTQQRLMLSGRCIYAMSVRPGSQGSLALDILLNEDMLA